MFTVFKMATAPIEVSSSDVHAVKLLYLTLLDTRILMKLKYLGQKEQLSNLCQFHKNNGSLISIY